MRGLLQLFAAYGNLLLFLFLEALSLVLVVQFNHRQKAIWEHSWSIATATFDYTADWLGDYWKLKEEVIKLQGENIQLMEQLDNAKYSNAIQQDTIQNDTLEQLYTYIGANIISNSTTSMANSIRLDKGSNHGIRPNMGVISTDGIVGVVRAVSPHFCKVMSLLHRETRIKAEIARNHYFGTLTWNGKDPQFMQLEAIPKHAEVQVGDTVMTSGYSQLFPPALIIGTVESYGTPSGENFYDIRVKLRNDLSNLRYAYIIKNEMWEEHQQLDESANE